MDTYKAHVPSFDARGALGKRKRINKQTDKHTQKQN